MLGLAIQSNDRVVLAAQGPEIHRPTISISAAADICSDYHKHENIDSAISAFNRALTLDPKYAQAYAALGKAYWLGYDEGQGGSEWMEKARSACDQAVSLSPNLAEGYTCLGYVYRTTGRVREGGCSIPEGHDAGCHQRRNFSRTGRRLPKVEQAGRGRSYISQSHQSAAAVLGELQLAGVFYWEQVRFEDAAKMFRKS